MKINNAYKLIEDLHSESESRRKQKTYKQLLGALRNLKKRDLSGEQLQAIESAIDRLNIENLGNATARELSKARRQFLKAAREILSLLPEDHYMGIGLCFGVAFGGVIGSLLQGFTGIPDGTSGTGIGIGLGLMLAYFVSRHLDLEAIRENRVLQTR
ncbi:MAG: hypothetical protein AB3N64_00035 [Puniceicoccaceae bacterium]